MLNISWEYPHVVIFRIVSLHFFCHLNAVFFERCEPRETGAPAAPSSRVGTYLCTAETSTFQQECVQLFCYQYFKNGFSKIHFSSNVCHVMLNFDEICRNFANVFRKWKTLLRFAECFAKFCKISKLIPWNFRNRNNNNNSRVKKEERKRENNSRVIIIN